VVDVNNDRVISSDDVDGDRDLYGLGFTIGADGEAESSGDPVPARATRNPGGAGKWRDAFSKALAAADLVVMPTRTTLADATLRASRSRASLLSDWSMVSNRSAMRSRL
jgi:hypothetical protein